MKTEKIISMDPYMEKVKDAIWDIIECYDPTSKTKYRAAITLCEFAGIDISTIDAYALTREDLADLIHEGYDELQKEWNDRYHPLRNQFD